VEELELEQFASRLQHLRSLKGWSQSDLAREVWGETTNREGRKVARNRDRISAYEMGKSWPDPHNLMKLVKALDTTPEYLAPSITGSTIERQNPEFSMMGIAGHADKVLLKVNRLMSMNIATMIIQLLDYASLVENGLADPSDPPYLDLPAHPTRALRKGKWPTRLDRPQPPPNS
jgi:transcriptional regulator with XRE-family HTH domain